MYAFVAASHARAGARSPARVLTAPLVRAVGRFILVLRPIVIDSGTRALRAGFAGKTAPRAVRPMALPARRGAPCPIERGVVSDWDAMEKIWHHTFYDTLGAVPSEQAILPTEKPLKPRRTASA